MKPSLRTARQLTALILGVCLSAGAVHAGIVDSPLPVLETGKKTLHVYSVPAYIRSGGLSSFFSCTSTDAATIRVGVEMFGSLGGAPVNDAVATSLSVGPGANVTFGTNAAAGIAIDSNVSGVSRGSARILATSRKLICTAFVADNFNAPPVTTWQLTIVKQKTQKGD